MKKSLNRFFQLVDRNFTKEEKTEAVLVITTLLTVSVVAFIFGTIEENKKRRATLNPEQALAEVIHLEQQEAELP